MSNLLNKSGGIMDYQREIKRKRGILLNTSLPIMDYQNLPWKSLSSYAQPTLKFEPERSLYSYLGVDQEQSPKR